MKIGELAKRSGLTASRIRFYEAEGLIRVVERQANGYREYPPEAEILLGLISIAQQAGFTLEQIRQLLLVGPGAWDHRALLDALKQKVEEIDGIRKRLDHTRAQLVVAIASIEDRPDGIECVDNKKRVLDRLREAGITPDLGKPDGSTTG
ncbi:MerR family transcriptional regulator [Burkholderia cenocepacia]|uniref:MerR family transcriptional regulator n=1 Tax=Burkholderia cenocepacia TaxID=95486 RepID=UPI0009820C4E|nr:MerR family transcriptional regulator [Burkholderia cenocepacia]ONR58186.1 MerR family transcriptional regulator [Burkholderia cenocepacia]ONR72192.1 MerR family transcriptional regulator [Burkholderia cenocepacia]ONR79604.1 MerR family transcriptional regulator [Burkholderia cenocepacia]ONR84663.1 MerR family transcriptional regulator [Burkholderia cenocepacia]ONR96862.1 MerR family transcriptional regulator [Burkholderia cenocepacia]